MQVDRLRLLGGYGSNKVMQGEASRLIGRAFDPVRGKELRESPPRKCGPGAISYPFSPDLAALLLSYHRTSARLLWDLYDLDCARLEPLYEQLKRAVAEDRRNYLDGIETISVMAFGTGPVQAGERQVVGTVKNALIDGAADQGHRLGVFPESPDLVFHARHLELEGEPPKLTISIDLAGRPLHRRGYRLAHGAAPLREDLAAQILFLARYDARRETIIDPLAGSGTLLIEAALLAQAAPRVAGPTTALSPLSCLAAELSRWGQPLFGDTQAIARGAELDPETLAAFEDNARAAGAADPIEIQQGDFRDLDLGRGAPPERPILVVSNPPYGARLDAGRADLRDLYRDLGRFCRNIACQRAAFLVGEPQDAPPDRESSVALFLRSFGGKPRVRKPLSNGPLRAQFLLYDF